MREAVEPVRFKSRFPLLPKENLVNFSDLNIVWLPLTRRSRLTPKGFVTSQILRLVHAQATLLFDEGIILRGGVTVGQMARSYGQIFGPAIVRAYELESKVAKFPRIVVDKTVEQQLYADPDLCVHDPDSEVAFLHSLLRKDVDGEDFIDYLSVIKGELDAPSDYPGYLQRHRDDPPVLAKYQWLNKYHRLVTAGAPRSR